VHFGRHRSARRRYNPLYDGGHLREPMLWMTNYFRAIGFTNTDPNSSYNSLSNYSTTLGQRPTIPAAYSISSRPIT